MIEDATECNIYNVIRGPTQANIEEETTHTIMIDKYKKSCINKSSWFIYISHVVMM